MSRERAHVMVIGQDFIDGHWDVSCFCGWSAETLWDDREGAEADYQRHKSGGGGRGALEASRPSASEPPHRQHRETDHQCTSLSDGANG